MNAKFLWLYLLTCPENTSLPGLLVGGPAHFTEAMGLGWSLKAFRDAFREAFAKGMAKSTWDDSCDMKSCSQNGCFGASVVWLPNALKYNPPTSPNIVIGWRVHLDRVPECALKDEACRAFAEYGKGMSKGFREAFAKVFEQPFGMHSGNGLAIQYQDQDQEQDLNPPTPKGERQKGRRCAPRGRRFAPGGDVKKSKTKTPKSQKDPECATETVEQVAADLEFDDYDLTQAHGDWERWQASRRTPCRDPDASFAKFLRRWVRPPRPPAHYPAVIPPPLTREQLEASARGAETAIQTLMCGIGSDMPIAEPERPVVTSSNPPMGSRDCDKMDAL